MVQNIDKLIFKDFLSWIDHLTSAKIIGQIIFCHDIRMKVHEHLIEILYDSVPKIF